MVEITAIANAADFRTIGEREQEARIATETHRSERGRLQEMLVIVEAHTAQEESLEESKG